MKRLSFKRHRFPADVILHAVWLYFRFTLSFRDVEDLLAERGVDVSYETIRCWAIKFGPQIARQLKKRRPSPAPRWHLDEMVCKVGGRRIYLWRAVDEEGEVLDLVMQRNRDTEAALRLLRRLIRNQPVDPIAIVTDGLKSYGSAFREPSNQLTNTEECPRCSPPGLVTGDLRLDSGKGRASSVS